MGFVPVFYLWVANMDVVKIIEVTVTGLGFELVDVERTGRGLLRVFIDKPDGIVVEDCQLVSNQLTRLFTVENIDYDRLEVSSPGLDRVLKKESDFVRFTGSKVQIKLRMPMGARKNFAGTLLAVGDGILKMDIEGVQVEIELANVDKARLVPAF
jgi:ribosome maturation factor RimP